MEIKSNLPKYTFLHAKAMLDELYDMRIMEDSFIEKAYISYKAIGNSYSYKHVFIGIVGADNKLELPDNVEYINMVNYPTYFYDILAYDNIFLYVNGSRLFSEVSDEWASRFGDKSVSDRNGHNLTYNLNTDGTISFPQGDFAGKQVAVLYDGLLVDEDCNPMLYYSEVKAIAHNVAYIEARKKAFSGDQLMGSLMQYAKKEADTAIANATIPERFTYNELDQLLNINVSYDRKVYNRAYKFKS